MGKAKSSSGTSTGPWALKPAFAAGASVFDVAGGRRRRRRGRRGRRRRR